MIPERSRTPVQVSGTVGEENPHAPHVAPSRSAIESYWSMNCLTLSKATKGTPLVLTSPVIPARGRRQPVVGLLTVAKLDAFTEPGL